MVLLACDVRHTQLGFERSERNEEEKEKDKKKEKEKKAGVENVGGNFEKFWTNVHIYIIQQPRDVCERLKNIFEIWIIP